MHYGRIYIQYFALWSSHCSGGLIVCVCVWACVSECVRVPVCVTTILKDNPYTVNASAQWTQWNNVPSLSCQLIFFFKRLLIWWEINELMIDWLIEGLHSRGYRTFRSHDLLCGAYFISKEKCLLFKRCFFFLFVFQTLKVCWYNILFLFLLFVEIWFKWFMFHTSY